MRSLFDISSDLLALDDILEESGGDVSDPQVEEALDSWFAQLSEERDQKVENYAAYIRELEARADALKMEAARLSDRRRSYENAAQHLKDRLKYAYELHGWDKIKTLRYTVSLSKNGGKLPLEFLCPEDEVPEEFLILEPKVDRDSIRTLLERGEELEFARLGERGSSIRIR